MTNQSTDEDLAVDLYAFMKSVKRKERDEVWNWS